MSYASTAIKKLRYLITRDGAQLLVVEKNNGAFVIVELDTPEARDAAVTAAVNDLLAGTPGALDTLNEFAAALGDDANFAATITTALGNRLEWKGNWAGATNYVKNDIVLFNGGLYAAPNSFTSGGAFNKVNWTELVPQSGTYAPTKDNSRTVWLPAGWGSFWQAKLAASGSGLAHVAVLGDSVGRGYWTSNLDLGWAGKLKTQLQVLYGDGGSGWQGVVDTITYVTSLPAANRVVVSGTWATSSNHDGPGANVLASITDGSTLTFNNVRGRFIDIAYRQDPSHGSFTYTVNGGTPVTVNAAGTASSQIITVDMTTAASRTVVITQMGTTITRFAGVRGRNSTGVLFDNFASSGALSSLFGGMASTTYGHPSAWSAGPSDVHECDLLIYTLAVNDAHAATPTTVDQYILNVRDTIDQHKMTGTKHGAVDVLFVMPHVGKFETSGVSNHLYAQYLLRLKALSHAYGAGFINLWAHPTWGRNNWDAAADNDLWSSDNTSQPATGAGTSLIHPGDTGHGLYYAEVAPIVTALSAA